MTRIQSLLNFSIGSEIKFLKRLPDLAAILELVSPKESNGKGLQIFYGIHDSPFGNGFMLLGLSKAKETTRSCTRLIF